MAAPSQACKKTGAEYKKLPETARIVTNIKPDPNAGATLINEHGVLIGEVGSIAGQFATVVMGGHQDVFSFWDMGGRRIHLPIDAIALGNRKPSAWRWLRC